MLSALKNFGVTFLIAATLFGILAYFATGFVTGTVKNILEDEQSELDEIIQSGEEVETAPSGEEQPGSEGEEEIPEGESFNFLVITTDYRPDLYNTYRPALSLMYDTDWNTVPSEETLGVMSGNYRDISLGTITLVRIDKEKRQVIYSSFSPKTRVYTTSGYHTLSEVYNIYGKQTVAEYINAITGLKFRYTLLLNGYNLDEFLELAGTTTVRNARDIYFDGTYATMQYETTAERIGSDGNPWTEHIPNTWLMGSGDIELNADRLYNMISVDERGMADFNAKSAYSIEMIRNYLAKIAVMEEKDRKILLAQLITLESGWGNIEGLEIPETEETEAMPEEIPEEQPETEPEIVDPKSRWTAELSEPETPVLDTNYTMNDYETIAGLLNALENYESVIVSYPYTYRAATDESEAYFDADTASGLDLYLSYRLISSVEQQTEN